MNAYRGLVRSFDLRWAVSPTDWLLSPDVSQGSFFDVPLHDNFWRASTAGSKYDLRKIFDNTVVRIRPKDAVTFVDNHE